MYKNFWLRPWSLMAPMHRISVCVAHDVTA